MDIGILRALALVESIGKSYYMIFKNQNICVELVYNIKEPSTCFHLNNQLEMN